MADYIGYSFQPGRDSRMRGSLNQGQLSPMASDALRVLSLRLPVVLGGTPIAPADLLQPHVGGSVPDTAVASSIARLGGGSPSAVPTPAPIASAGPVTAPITTTRYTPSPAPIPSGSRPSAPSASPGSAPSASAPITRPNVRNTIPRSAGGGIANNPFGGFSQPDPYAALGALASAMVNSTPGWTIGENNLGQGFGPFNSFGNYTGGGSGTAEGWYGTNAQAT